MIKAPALTCLTVAFWVLPVSIASAQSIEAARAALDEGRFMEATELAESLETSDGYALAARSLAIHGYHFAKDDEKQALFERATKLAREAVQIGSTESGCPPAAGTCSRKIHTNC